MKPYLCEEQRKLNESPDIMTFDYLEHLHQVFADLQTPTDVLDIRLSEVIQFDDARVRDSRMAKPIQNEVKDLFRRGTFKAILEEEIL